MDVLGALHEGLWLEYRDKVFFQVIDYEKIPFRCRKCHEHGHLIWECPLHRLIERLRVSQEKIKMVLSDPWVDTEPIEGTN